MPDLLQNSDAPTRPADQDVTVRVVAEAPQYRRRRWPFGSVMAILVGAVLAQDKIDKAGQQGFLGGLGYTSVTVEYAPPHAAGTAA